MARLSLIDTLTEIAPTAPPCFDARSDWLEYLRSACGTQTSRNEPKVIVIVAYKPAFNWEFPFCEDCAAPYRTEMQRQKMKDGKPRCQPDHLEQEKARIEEETRQKAEAEAVPA